MIIKKDTNKEIYCRDNASGFLIANGNNCEYVKLVLAPGSKIDVHALPFPVTFYILQGNLKAVLEDAVYETNKGDLLEVEKNIQRGWQNSSNETAELLVIKHLD